MISQVRYGIMELIAIAFFSLSNCNTVLAQNEWNVWHFGSLAGLDFNTGTPMPLSDGSLSTVEGCASISDKYGRLLFYTDGVKVWDRYHGIMPNGIGLFGHFSTTQCQIIPSPGDSTRYYIFTADFQGNKEGLCYSIIDLKKNNGLGEVVVKNKRLQTPVTEKICAVRHRNGRDFWIIAHEWQSSRFLSYRVSPSGVSVPVVSDQGSSHANGFRDMNAIGSMKVSRDARQLALAIHDANIVELFQFDNSTGDITHQKSLFFGAGSGPYGLEFSPNGKWLYVGLFNAKEVLQVDLSQPTGTDMVKNAFQVVKDIFFDFGALQLGPDGRIYIACHEKPHLSVIHFPDRKGAACTFELEGVLLGDRNSSIGLPSAIPSFFPRFRFGKTCFGDTVSFSIPETAQLQWVQWDFGDPASGAQNYSSDTAPVHFYQAPGTYKVLLVCNIGGQLDSSTAYVNIQGTPHINLGDDTIICGTAVLKLSAYTPGAHYFWQNTGRKPEMIVTQPGTYWVKVYNHCGWTADTIDVRYDDVPVIELGKDSVFCDEVNYELKASWPGGQVRWQDGSADSILKLVDEGTYYVTVTTPCGAASDTIHIGKRRCNLASSIEMPNVITPNGDGLNEEFLPTCKNIDRYEVRLYNRWGQEVFFSNNIDLGWTGISNGRELKVGVYYYQVKATGADGLIYDRAGTVTLLR